MFPQSEDQTRPVRQRCRAGRSACDYFKDATIETGNLCGQPLIDRRHSLRQPTLEALVQGSNDLFCHRAGGLVHHGAQCVRGLNAESLAQDLCRTPRCHAFVLSMLSDDDAIV